MELPDFTGFPGFFLANAFKSITQSLSLPVISFGFLTPLGREELSSPVIPLVISSISQVINFFLLIQAQDWAFQGVRPLCLLPSHSESGTKPV